jgi:hypothetical protein
VPADLFRPVAKKGPSTLPYSVGSLFVMMCAPEQQGWGGITRAVYDRTPSMHVDIPADRKRAMWACVKGLMTCWRDIGYRAPSAVSTDEGAVLSPILMEFIRREAADRERGNGEGEAWLNDTASRLDTWLRTGGELSFGPGVGPGWYNTIGYSADRDASATCGGSCYGGASSLVVPFTELIAGWQTTLNDAARRGFDEEISARRAGNWALQGRPGGKTITIPPTVARQLLRKSSLREQALKTAEPTGSKDIGAGAKAMLVLGGLGGSYLLYRGAKAAVRRFR